MRPLVSVAVCAYNAESSIARTLDSLLAQTLHEMEIIVINDGSQDGTAKILEKYQSAYPEKVFVYSKKNEGIAAARNYALDQITGEYFGWLDSDDTCEPEMFMDLYNSAKTNDSELVVSNFWWVNEKGKRMQKEGPYKPGREMMIGLFCTLWNKLYRTDYIKTLDIRFPVGNRYEDACFLYCLACRVKKISFVDRAYVNYQQVSGSITHHQNNAVKNMITVFRLILEYYRKHGYYDTYRNELEYIHIKFFLGNNFLRSSKIKDPKDRKETILLGWNLLNEEFPNWHSNPYMKTLGGMKNRYFSMVTKHNLFFFSWFFRHFSRNNL